MAMDGRRSKAIAQIINAREIKERQKARDEEKKMKEKRGEISEEEHRKRMEYLKSIGVIK